MERSSCEGDWDAGFHSPKGMSKGSLAATFDRERAALAGREAEGGGRPTKPSSAKFSFLGAGARGQAGGRAGRG